MGDVFECSEVDSFIGGVAFGGHVSVVGEDFANVFGGEELFGVVMLLLLGGGVGVCGCEATTVGVAFGLQFGPSFGFFFKREWLLLLWLLL